MVDYLKLGMWPHKKNCVFKIEIDESKVDPIVEISTKCNTYYLVYKNYIVVLEKSTYINLQQILVVVQTKIYGQFKFVVTFTSNFP